MAAFRSMFVVLVISAVSSEAVFLAAGAAAAPLIIGGKLILVPKILAAKAGIGMLGLKIAGARHLWEKVLIPASMAGAVAGYKATSTVMDAPYKLAEAKTLAVEKLVHGLPKLPSIPTVPAPASHFEKTFTIPAVPVPGIQWQKKSVTYPHLVFTQPQSKTITISKHIEPGHASPEPPKEEIVDRPY